jgi:hypothetical protein
LESTLPQVVFAPLFGGVVSKNKMLVGMGILFFKIHPNVLIFSLWCWPSTMETKIKKKKLRLKAQGHGLYAKPNISPM